MAQGIRPDGQVFASNADDGELENFPAETRGWGVTIDGKDAEGNTVTEPTNGIPPMEWMNGILNKLSNQILWNMQHAVPSWAAGIWDAEAFVTYSGWIYYNGSGAQTTDTPESGTAWTKLFPLSNIDGRYLQIANNLSEIATAGAGAQSTARDSLGIGSIATHGEGDFLPITGGEITGPVTIDADDYSLVIRNKSQNSPLRLVGANADGNVRWYVGNGVPNDAALHLVNIGAGSNGIIVSADGSISLATTNGMPVFVNTELQAPNFTATSEMGFGSYAGQYNVKAPYYTEFNDSGTSVYHPLWKMKDLYNGLMWSGGMIINDGGFVIHFTDAAGNNRIFEFAKDGTFIPASYANFDARYQAAGAVADVQLGAIGSYVPYNNESSYDFYAPYGCVLSGINIGDTGNNSADNVNVIYYKPIQKYVLGTWITVAG